MEQTNDPVIQTASGRTVDLSDPHVFDIDIHDIAHALGQLCRFTGHTNQFYSVAEHCVHCSELVLDFVPPDELKKLSDEQKRILQIEALLHDAAEAYLGDVSRPLKSILNSYKTLEKMWESIITSAFGIRSGKTNAVAKIDHIMNVTEFKHLMSPPPTAIRFNMVISYDNAIDDFPFRCLTPVDASIAFLDRFKELTNGTNSSVRDIVSDNMKNQMTEVATEHVIKLVAQDIIDETLLSIENYVQTVAGTKFLAEPDNTIKGHLVALLVAYDERSKVAQVMIRKV